MPRSSDASEIFIILSCLFSFLINYCNVPILPSLIVFDVDIISWYKVVPFTTYFSKLVQMKINKIKKARIE